MITGALDVVIAVAAFIIFVGGWLAIVYGFLWLRYNWKKVMKMVWHG